MFGMSLIRGRTISCPLYQSETASLLNLRRHVRVVLSQPCPSNLDPLPCRRRIVTIPKLPRHISLDFQYQLRSGVWYRDCVLSGYTLLERVPLEWDSLLGYPEPTLKVYVEIGKSFQLTPSSFRSFWP